MSRSAGCAEPVFVLAAKAVCFRVRSSQGQNRSIRAHAATFSFAVRSRNAMWSLICNEQAQKQQETGIRCASWLGPAAGASGRYAAVLHDRAYGGGARRLSSRILPAAAGEAVRS